MFDNILILVWLSLLTLFCLGMTFVCVYLWKQQESNRLSIMNLRARINPLSEKGDPVSFKIKLMSEVKNTIEQPKI